MPNPLDKIVNLIKKTGDNSIILDSHGEPQYVVMSFEKYQKMVTADKDLAGLTESQLLEKINEDVAAWRQSNAGNSEIMENLSELPDVNNQVTNSVLPSAEVEKSLESPENSLNEAKNNSTTDSNDHNEDKYYFEPID